MNFQSPKSKAQNPKPNAGRVFGFGHWTLDSRFRPSNFGDRDGVALVITLIMLAIITFMAVTFLVLSQRERSSIGTAMDQKTARNASDAGFARVSAELLTRIMLHTNFQDFDLLASTNYINLHGLHGGVPGSLSPTNVNYDYLDDAAHSPLTPQDRNINIASLLYNPRPPVYVTTNIGTGQSEFRYYLDLNRNGRDDPNGDWPVVVLDGTGKPAYLSTNTSGLFFVPTNYTGWVVSNTMVGDPEWIGQLARPEELHAADNQFVARYAYIVIPVGKTLDVNTMHNQAVTKSLVSANNDGYLRNQGVGPWELNLAAFLVDLNTNIWDARPLFPQNFYQYNRGDVNSFAFPGANKGLAFQDAFSLLSYRYNNDYTTLTPASQAFPFAGTALVADNIDEYSDGPLMTTFSINESSTPDQVGQLWSGAENLNHYFTSQDYFDKTKTSFGQLSAPGFSSRLQQVSGSNDTYNAYTFYRMIAQLGTDSTVDNTKLNINYKNTDIHGNIVPDMETNLIPWTPEDFFTNAANRILAQFTNDMGVALSTTYIPLYPTNYYTPAVHRALQLAANIFDATTNQTVALLSVETNAFYPSVFRPVFTSQGGQVWISGYKEVVDTTPLDSFQWWDLNTASNSPGVYPFLNIYGVPWVVGAKKGWPNFNQFAMQTDYQLIRKLGFIKNHDSGGSFPNPSDYSFRQMYNMTVSNSLGFQAWNSYHSAWPITTRPLRVFATNIFSLRVLNHTNPAGIDLIPPATYFTGTNSFISSWQRYDINFPSASMNLFDSTNYLSLDGNAFAYRANVPAFRLGTNYDQTAAAIPPFYMVTTNRVVYALIDMAASPNRIVDFVNLDDSGKVIDFTGALLQYAQCNPVRTAPMDPAVMWCTNKITGVPVSPDAVSQGLDYQIEANLGMVDVLGWNATATDPGNAGQINQFRTTLLQAHVGSTNQAPYNPTFGITNLISWEANDPLVHYTIPDLTDQNSLNKWNFPPQHENHRYAPWNRDDGSGNIDTQNLIQGLAKKDPMYDVSGGVGDSDSWDFPTNKFWNVGILGRVHRGTPWQTVYMKSPIIKVQDWQKWSGSVVLDTNAVNNVSFADAALTMPTQDYGLFDLFTAAINPSAARGQLNINQTNLAAWSAVLSGVNIMTNAQNATLGPQIIGSAVIAPAGVYTTNNPTPVARIWMGINNARANVNTNNLIFTNSVFQRLGDVLSAPELTVSSPFINTNWFANDEVYERIPQQIMSLLTLNQTPRFVIYSFGQTLHPADKSLVMGGTFNGLCTNYQITAESAVRAVVRVEGTPDPQYVGGKVDSQGRSYPPHLVVEQYNVLGPD